MRRRTRSSAPSTTPRPWLTPSNAFPEQIAAVLLEPVAGNMGLVPPRPGYLERLRELTEKHGALLIFDEVMTGFRLAFGGAQERYGVTPDLTALGKIIGGGLPAAAYGALGALMDHVSPVGPDLPGRHALGQSAGHGRRPGHLANPPRSESALRAAGGLSARLAEGLRPRGD